MNLKWDTAEKRKDLLCELVSWHSRSGTDGEINFPHRLKEKLLTIPYFKVNASHIHLVDANKNRNAITALYKTNQTKETIVLLSHFDTVHTSDYGSLEEWAFSPEELTKRMVMQANEYPELVKEDLLSGQYLFGRGTMDMKAGLAAHLSIIEKACEEAWPINLLLLTVPDEEVDSSGMRAAAAALVEIQDQYDLSYKLFLNGEPTFAQTVGDPNSYIYSGSIGKIMPSALVYGKETHVGEPLSGITANYIASFLTQRMEWTTKFQEEVLGEKTPLPVLLRQRDFNMEYSVQTPYRLQILYNVFLMKQDAAQVMETFQSIAEEAAKECTDAYYSICERENVEPIGEIKVWTYEKLHGYALKKLGEPIINTLVDGVMSHDEWDNREKSFRIADELIRNCQEIGPVMILLFAPPYYPAVNSSDDELVKKSLQLVKDYAQTIYETELIPVHYFNGISDLSYLNYQGDTSGWLAFQNNTPVWNRSYMIPFEAMAKLQAPVMNIGPFGKDPHKRTERLHLDSAFVVIPNVIETMIKNVFINK